MKVLFVGDIVGNAGRTALRAFLPKLRDRYRLDAVIANGENAAGGFGITEKVASEILAMGVNVITGGNHIWDKKEAVNYLARENRVLRPLNYPPGVPGTGSTILDVKGGLKLAVLNVSGRVFMQNYDCPFRGTEAELERLRGITANIIVDFHAEATSEKIAYGFFLDGRVSAVIGTHTHVQTADEKVLPGGTAYITDVGMTGPIDSVIGVNKEQIIRRFLSLMPTRFEVSGGPAMLSAVALELDDNSGKCLSIHRLLLTHQ